MEKDEQLKQLLQNSAAPASAGFTDAVMSRIKSLPAASCQPLVPTRLVQAFLWVFGAVVVSILGLCLIGAVTSPGVVGWLQNTALSQIDYTKVLIFLLTFWGLFAVQARVERKLRAHSGSRGVATGS